MIKVKLNVSETCKDTEETVLQKMNCLHPVTNELHTFSPSTPRCFNDTGRLFRLPMVVRLTKKLAMKESKHVLVSG